MGSIPIAGQERKKNENGKRRWGEGEGRGGEEHEEKKMKEVVGAGEKGGRGGEGRGRGGRKGES